MKKVVRLQRESDTWTKIFYKLKSNGITYSYFMSTFDCEHPVNNIITCSVFNFKFKLI